MGKVLNPIVRLSPRDLLTSDVGVSVLREAGLDTVGHRRETVSWTRGPELLATRPAAFLGDQTTIETYAGILAGDPPTVAFVHLSRVEARSVVVASAIHGTNVDRVDRSYAGSDGYRSRTAVTDTATTFAGILSELEYD